MLEAPEPKEREREVGKKQQKPPRCDEAREEGGKVEEGARAREAAISIAPPRGRQRQRMATLVVFPYPTPSPTNAEKKHF